jgi:hypothetical protein
MNAAAAAAEPYAVCRSTSSAETLHCLLLLLLLVVVLAGSGLATNIRDFFSLGKGAKANKRTEQDLKGFGQGQGA